MPKRTEKEPLLFVDTQYKGCFVNEQSFFKTPGRKSQNIALSNYVHNYDDFEPVDFDELVSEKPITITETIIEPEMDEDLEMDHYETVNIIVDQEGIESSSYLEVTPNVIEENYLDKEEELSVEEIPLITSQTDFSELPQQEPYLVQQSDSYSVLQSKTPFNLEKEQPLDLSQEIEEEEPIVELDEKRQELLALIKDLTNRPSMMKAPIVQVVFKDGQLKSGLIELVDNQTITVDNMMDEPIQYSLSQIEGIRILHL